MLGSFLRNFLIALTVLIIIAGVIMSTYFAAIVSWVLALVVFIVELSILVGLIGMIVDCY